MIQATHSQVNQPGPEDKIFFYPKEFYVFDNFTAFQVEWKNLLWPTSEHAFQAARYMGVDKNIVNQIKLARSVHDAQKIAYQNINKQNPNWSNLEVDVMKQILRCKIEQHPYVLKKLKESGNREIIEDSWRDSTWGWGEDHSGENRLGKIWMELRKEYLQH